MHCSTAKVCTDGRFYFMLTNQSLGQSLIDQSEFRMSLICFKQIICVTISNEISINFFRMNKEEINNQSWMGYFGKALMTPASYLPSQVTEVFSQGRAFAIAKLPHAGKFQNDYMFS